MFYHAYFSNILSKSPLNSIVYGHALRISTLLRGLVLLLRNTYAPHLLHLVVSKRLRRPCRLTEGSDFLHPSLLAFCCFLAVCLHQINELIRS